MISISDFLLKKKVEEEPLADRLIPNILRVRSPILHPLPQNCSITNFAYRPTADLIRGVPPLADEERQALGRHEDAAERVAPPPPGDSPVERHVPRPHRARHAPALRTRGRQRRHLVPAVRRAQALFVAMLTCFFYFLLPVTRCLRLSLCFRTTTPCTAGLAFYVCARVVITAMSINQY